MQHLTQSRIAAALAAATQPEGERPWRLLLTKPPMTHADVRSAITLEQNPSLRRFSGMDEATCRAEASRARIVQELARRDGYMAALAVTEQMMSTTPVLPTNAHIELGRHANGPLISWHFHHSAADVRAFAAHFNGELAETPHNDTTVYLAATGTACGIRFEAFTLADTEQVAA